MSSSKNLEYEKTAFLNKSNSAFIEEMHLKFVNNDPTLPPSWKKYFNEIGDESETILKEINGPSWGPSKKFSIKVTQQTNEKNISDLKDFYFKNNVENNIFSFDKNFTNIIKQADLCITRAGASTLSELSVLNIPFITVPLPSSKDNHQFENANFYKRNDCCWIIEQNVFEEEIET